MHGVVSNFHLFRDRFDNYILQANHKEMLSQNYMHSGVFCCFKPINWLSIKYLHFQATADLEDIDKKRKDEFKTYELEKEHLRREKLKQMDEIARKKAEIDHEQQLKKHKEHKKVNHPVSRHNID